MSTTTTKSKLVSFYSSSPNLRVVRVPTVKRTTDYGTTEVPGLAYDFNGHFLHVPEGKDPIKDGPLDDTYEATFQDSVSWLRSKAAEKSPDDPDHFSEYEAPVPSSAAILAEIMQAVGDKNADRLTAIYDEEQEGHQREDVLEACLTGFNILDSDTPPAA